VSTHAHTHAQIDLLEEFATTAEWFAVTVASVDTRSAVPTCPGWTTYDLVMHLGNVHAWAATVVETGRAAPEQNDEPSSRKSKAVAEWYAGKAEDLYEVLRSTNPDAPCWNFAFGVGKAGFWRRRQLHETTIHGVDLALASGRIPDLGRDVSEDGIDEALRVFLHRMHKRGYPADLSAPIGIVATDVDRAWTVRPSPGSSPEVLAGLSEGAGRIEGPAAAVYALLWKRLPASDPSLTFTGDQDRISAFLASRLTA
jgi:uncharacterized protein (TIGR03083 family)